MKSRGCSAPPITTLSATEQKAPTSQSDKVQLKPQYEYLPKTTFRSLLKPKILLVACISEFVTDAGNIRRITLTTNVVNDLFTIQRYLDMDINGHKYRRKTLTPSPPVRRAVDKSVLVNIRKIEGPARATGTHWS